MNAEIIDPFIRSPRPSRNIKTVFELCRRAGFLFVALITTSSQLYIIIVYRRRGRAFAINRNRPRGIKARAFEKLKRVTAIHHRRRCAEPNITRSPFPSPRERLSRKIHSDRPPSSVPPRTSHCRLRRTALVRAGEKIHHWKEKHDCKRLLVNKKKKIHSFSTWTTNYRKRFADF